MALMNHLLHHRNGENLPSRSTRPPPNVYEPVTVAPPCPIPVLILCLVMYMDWPGKASTLHYQLQPTVIHQSQWTTSLLQHRVQAPPSPLTKALIRQAHTLCLSLSIPTHSPMDLTVTLLFHYLSCYIHHKWIQCIHQLSGKHFNIRITHCVQTLLFQASSYSYTFLHTWTVLSHITTSQTYSITRCYSFTGM